MDGIPKSTLGLHTLYCPESGAVLDVVAVHGLGGDSFSTWSDGDILWLRDLLPQSPEFKKSRIMTFGYDATAFTKPFAKTTTGRTFTFAEALLNDLSDSREEFNAVGRPLIFLGHSLGGIVIKAALRHARERPAQYKDILESTKAIMFFGTPHQGADAATWAGYLSKIGRVIGVKNTEVTAELQRWSNPLTELTKVFSENQENIAITTFYESRSLHGTIVVPEASATMGWKDERCVKLDGTHTSICRLTETDPNWRTVRTRLNVVAKSLLGLAAGVPNLEGLVKGQEETKEVDAENQHFEQKMGARMEALKK
ncbi:hypothetical protein AA0116_g73 [Alternaria tenuissima]|nr:hypothetical protein AA0116_g73 [Alternaria tenuissima]